MAVRPFLGGALDTMVDYLVICPSGRMQLWVSALQQLAPSTRVLVNQGTPTQRKNALLSQPRDYDLLLTPYSLAIKDTLHLCKLRWKVVVWDDGLSELRRGFREGSQTWALHQGVNKRAAHCRTDYNILLSPARVTNADYLLWLVHNHLGARLLPIRAGVGRATYACSESEGGRIAHAITPQSRIRYYADVC
ncbi:hypothetical protein EMIHUDRAFT_220877 [Emiliania huxleyi CCMP1516]|uniref:SNF2 N-terminal domain-containing protein n=2 Tax=Emiliania huxleyi TaxID=2903 RepID=A0A0D3I0E9_EMIH1|nr:hypothetical protein EMIHUDRAFT_220877 [Emiliania huxleyi CCMP1516]EOD04734.1 hypothetical protein EMIHUDRAFT_220877 [Emiliania huxleyi CCMP1516]|eukprot:XP_005757163.1 hypothetical protein EMIHUDRAFT_220877 [Emiliania huxleyi CCMP1516]